jgi:hypothetical protein
MRGAAEAAAGRVSLLGIKIAGFERASIAAELDGSGIASLAIDLTGLEIALADAGGSEGAAHDGSGPDSARAPETNRTAGELRSATITAHPALLAGAAIDLDAVVEHVPFDWVERSDGTLELDALEGGSATAGRTGLERLRADVTISIAQGDLAPLVVEVVNVALVDAGASISDLQLSLTSAATDVVEFDATAKASYGVMSAGVRLRGTASILDGGRIRLEHLDLSTRNVLARALLGLAKGELEKLDGRELDLADLLPAGLGAAEVHVEVTEALVTLTAAVAP